MKIDRNARFSSNVTALDAFAKECLGCKECQGVCQAYLELTALPQAILHRSASKGETA